MLIKRIKERKKDRERNKKEETSTLQQEIKEDNSKFKPGNHTVRNRIQYDNRTTEKKNKLRNKINNKRYSEMTNIIDAIQKSIVG